MMQAVNPYSGGSRSKAEILARYRPIAPKPEPPTSPSGDSGSNALPESIRKSAFLRNVWPHLQARPTRTRKRGRSAFALPPLKRARVCFQGLAPPHPYHHQVLNSSAANTWPNYSNGFPPQIPIIHPNPAPLKCGVDTPAETSSGGGRLRGIDLNREAEAPEEFDFMPQLHGGVITPQPVRLVGSTIFIGCIIHTDPPEIGNKPALKNPEDVENEVEAVTLPVIVSDMNNKVRLANSAYKELVGQPECRWLDRLPPFCNPCKKICGEVVIQFSDSCNLPISSNRFTCWVRIEWCSNGKKTTVRAFCDAVKLASQSKDYQFQWRFHTSSDNSPKSACFQQR